MQPFNETFPAKLGAALASWLNFQFVLEKSAVFNESFLNFPISDFLIAKKDGEVYPQFSHPVFGNRRIDFYVRYLNERNPFAVLLENKWIRESTRNADEKQRVLDDLLRLYFAKKQMKQDPESHSSEIICVFVIAGERKDFDEHFLKLSPPTVSTRNSILGVETINKLPPIEYKSWFSLEMNTRKEINVAKCENDDLQTIYNNFQEKYLINSESSIKMPESFCTKLVYLNNYDEKWAPMTVAIWSVEAAD